MVSEGNQEIFSLEELVKEFDYHNMSKSPAVFDIQKLKWMNGEYLKAMDFEKFYARAENISKKLLQKIMILRRLQHLLRQELKSSRISKSRLTSLKSSQNMIQQCIAIRK